MAEPNYATDISCFAEKFQTINEQGKRVDILPHHRRLDAHTMVFDATTGLFVPRMVIEGAVKKSAKTYRAGVKVNWWAMCHGPCEVNIWANDFEQSQARVFATAAALCERNGFVKHGIAKVLQSEIRFKNGSVVKALASDYKGGAGSRATLNVFDELWGFESERAERLFEEATPIPTAENAWILIVTTAGFVGESKLLERLYQRGLEGVRVDDELPIYRNGRMFMYWDHEPRCPWHTPAYLAEQRVSLRPLTYLRLWENRWVSASSKAISAEVWDACVSATLTPVLADRDLEVIVGADLALKHDCAAVVVVAWDGTKLRLVAHRIWKPTPGQSLDLEATVEAYIRELHDRFSVREVVIDPWQAARSIATLKADGIPIRELPQTQSTLTAMASTLFDALEGKNIRLYPAPDLREHALNAIAVETPRGMKLAKPKASMKVDAVVALSMACLTAVEHGPEHAMPLLYSSEPGSAYQEWLQRRGGSKPEPEPEEIVTVTDAEWAAMTPDEQAEWEIVGQTEE